MIRDISVISSDKKFLKRLLTLRSIDDAQKAFGEKGIALTINDICTIGRIVNDIEQNEEKLSNDQISLISGQARQPWDHRVYDEKVYKLFYGLKNNGETDSFFSGKEYYKGDTISSGIFCIAGLLYGIRRQYGNKESLWDIDNDFITYK